jgi:hypothetical protein
MESMSPGSGAPDEDCSVSKLMGPERMTRRKGEITRAHSHVALPAEIVRASTMIR